MSNPMKSIKEELDELLGIEPSKERIIKRALEINEIRYPEGMEMEPVMLNGKIKFEGLRNTLDVFQMNELKANLIAEIKF